MTEGYDELIEAEKVFNLNEGETIEAYKCPNCEELSENPEDAEMWQCVGCDEKYEDKDDAYNCCG